MDRPHIFKNPRGNIGRQDNKLILKCQSCHYQALVDVRRNGVTDWVCPACRVKNRVTSETKQREEFEKHLSQEIQKK